MASSAVAGLSQTPGMLIACRVFQGIGAGGLTALAQVVMAAMIAPRERGRYSGYDGDLHIDSAGNASGVLRIEAATISTGIKRRDAHLRSTDFFAVEEHSHRQIDGDIKLEPPLFPLVALPERLVEHAQRIPTLDVELDAVLIRLELLRRRRDGLLQAPVLAQLSAAPSVQLTGAGRRLSLVDLVPAVGDVQDRSLDPLDQP